VRQLETGADSLRPFVALNRLIHALQDVAQRSENPEPYQHLVTVLKQEILPRWTQLEPDPPFRASATRKSSAIWKPFRS